LRGKKERATRVIGRRRSAPQHDAATLLSLNMLLITSTLPHLKAAGAVALALLETPPATADEVIAQQTVRKALSKDEPNPLEDGLPRVR
jgi:hypothetical protein